MLIRKSFSSATAMLVGFFFTTLATVAQDATEKLQKLSEDALIYETIGMMFAQGSGLGKMQFTEEQIDHILSGMKKGFSMKEMPPEHSAVQQKVQVVLLVQALVRLLLLLSLVSPLLVGLLLVGWQCLVAIRVLT